MFDGTVASAVTDRQRELAVVNSWVTNASSMREQLFDRLLDPRRDINKECGFPSGFVDADYYWQLFKRTAIATRVVEVMPKECWQVQPSVFETYSETDVTPFEQAWDKMGSQLRGENSKFKSERGSPVWEYLIRADIMCGIGRYGVILLGLDDDMPLFMPVKGVEEEGSIPKDNPDTKEKVDKSKAAGTDQFYYDWAQRVKATGNWPKPTANAETGLQQWPRYRLTSNAFTMQDGGDDEATLDGTTTPESDFTPKVNLKYIRVFPEHLAQITQFESNPNSPRFGQPVMYLITFNDPNSNSGGGTGIPMASLNVHWTRVIHVADNLTSNETFGTPRMEPVLDNILGLRKMYAGAPEMYWKAAFMGLSLETNPQLGGDVEVDKDGLRQMVSEYHNGLTRALTLMGMTAKTLAPTVSDPTANIAVQLEIIAIKLSMPVRILKGSERGELASSQDDASWNDELKARNDLFTTPRLIVPFVDRLVLCGVLPEPDEYYVEWPDLDSQTDADKANVCSVRTTALQAYIAGNVASIIPPRDYLVNIMGLGEDMVDAMMESAAQAQADQLQEQQNAGLVDEAGQPIPQQTGQVDELGNPVTEKVDPAAPDHLKPASGGAPAFNADLELSSAYNFESLRQDAITNAEEEDEVRYQELANAIAGWDDGFILNFNPFHGHAGRFSTKHGTTVTTTKVGKYEGYDVTDKDGGYMGSVHAYKDDATGAQMWAARHIADYDHAKGFKSKQYAIDHVHQKMHAFRNVSRTPVGPEPWTEVPPPKRRHDAMAYNKDVTFTPEQVEVMLKMTGNYNPNHDAGGRFASAPGGAHDKPGVTQVAAKPQKADTAAKTSAPIAHETIAPNPVKVYKPNVRHDKDGDGVTDAARVGVPGKAVPPPPKIKPLPNLTPHERAVEKSFMDAFHANPGGMAEDFRKAVIARRDKKAAEGKGKPDDPPEFGTDDAKELHKSWSDPSMSLEQRSFNRATLNNVLHQTANAIAKRAFIKHLDTLKPGDEVLVTVGGCGAGKGYALGNVPQAQAMKAKAKAVWDSAGDQNATENPWIHEELTKRGLVGNYVFVHADPYSQWAHPERGVVKRAGDPKDGRMVDAKVFADSYDLGAKNHQAFYEKYKDHPAAKFVFLENKGKPALLPGIPPEALKVDSGHLAKFAIDQLPQIDAPDHVKRGATTGVRIWLEDPVANVAQNAFTPGETPGVPEADGAAEEQAYQDELAERDRLTSIVTGMGARVGFIAKPIPLNSDGSEKGTEVDGDDVDEDDSELDSDMEV